MALTSEKAKQSEFNKPNIQYCQYCGKECKNKNSLINHERLCKSNPNKQDSNLKSPKNKVAWNKGLTSKTDQRVANHSIAVKEYYKTHDGAFKGKHHTEKTKERLSKNALDNGWESHFGSHKSYWYKGIKFASSYELQVANSLDINGIEWVRSSSLHYIDNVGKKHHYTADFYLPEYDIYLDPKNDFLIENVNPRMGYSDVEKINWVMEQNNVKVVILDKNNLDWESIKNLI